MAGYRSDGGRGTGGHARSPRPGVAGARSDGDRPPTGNGYRRGETHVRESGGRSGGAWGGHEADGDWDDWRRDQWDGRAFEQRAGRGQRSALRDPGPWRADAAPGRVGDDPRRPHRSRRRRDPTGGAEGNERLTGLTGAVLLVLFAVEGLTIVGIHRLMTLHFFFGMLLIGPVVLKVGSTAYRFARYYTGAPEYRRKGPPTPLLRLLGPFVLLLSLAVIGSGVMLAVAGPGVGIWIFAHKASFVLWFGAMTIHVLAYVWRLPQLISGDVAMRAGRRANEVLGGRAARWLLLSASLLTGVLLAVVTMHRAGLWSGFVGGG